MASEPTLQPVGKRTWLSWTTERPVAVSMLMLALLVFGIVSFSKLRVDLMPEISYPALTVRTSWPGAAPEDVEQRLSERVQEALSTLPHLVRSSSISRPGVSDVVLDFDWGTQMTFAVQDVREKLDGVFLPRGAERPLILRYDPNLDPILRIGMTRPDASAKQEDLVQLRWLAEERIQRELESIAGVAAVTVRGGLEEEIRVRVDPFKLAARQLDPALIQQRLAQENINASGGSLREGSTEYLVRTLNEFTTVDEIADLALARRGASVVRLCDVATVERTHKKREVVSRIGGLESVELEIYREAGANIVELAARIRARVFGTSEQQAAALLQEQQREAGTSENLGERQQTEYLAWRLRKDAKLELLSDQSTFIRDAIDDLKNSAVMGALLAVLVLWLFLRQLAPTLIVAVVIPISIAVTFAPMYLFDVTLNVMSLGGLALGAGMLIDNAIVELESVTRCRESGDGLADAAVRGVSEVAAPLIASTITTVTVFLPIVFVSGVAGQIFGDQSLTVVTSQAVSLGIALLLIPMLTGRSWVPAGKLLARFAPLGSRPGLLARLGQGLLLLPWRLLRLVVQLLGALGLCLGVLLRPLSWSFEYCWSRFERAYQRALAGALRIPAVVLLVGVAVFAFSLTRIPHLGVELLPEVHQGEFTAMVELEVGSPLENTERVMRVLDQRVRALEGVGMTALMCGIETETLSRDIEGPHTARLTVRMPESAHDARSEDVLAEQVRSLLLEEPGVRSVEIRRPTPFALAAPIEVEVRGRDLAMIAVVTEEVARRMELVEGLSDVQSSLRTGYPEARISFDRDKTLEYGLDLMQVSNLVRDQVLGNVSTRFVEGDERIDVRVQGDEQLLATLEDVLDLVVNPSSPTPVPLRAVAELESIQGPAEIRRIGNTRAAVVTANTSGLDLGGVGKRIEAALADMQVPAEIEVELAGQKREMDGALSSMRYALALAIFLVYVVLAMQFESLLQPLVILLAVPMAVVGVILVLELCAVPLSVIVFLGLILLAGVVVNNAIVLLDRVNQQRALGLTVNEAVREAGMTRLRPILMTTLTGAIGLLPLTGWLEFFQAPLRALLAPLLVEGSALCGPLESLIALFGAGQGAEMRSPLAITVIAGMTTSTLLTLLVIPAFYVLVVRDRREAGVEPLA